MKKIATYIMLVIFVIALTACSGEVVSSAVVSAAQPATGSQVESVSAVASQQETELSTPTISVEYDREDLVAQVNTSEDSLIRFEGDAISLEGSGATVDGNLVTITSAGTYRLSGTLNDGQVSVDTQEEGTVTLVLNGVGLTNSTRAPIYVRNAQKTVITLAEGTDNTITDGSAYVFEEPGSDEPDAAIFSNDDLTINGNGSLTVNANYNNGITSQDELKITGGSLIVNAVNDGLKGRDLLAVKDGSITVNSGGDGLQSNNDEQADKGTIVIEGGSIQITAELDGIQAAASLLVSGGEIAITSGGGSANSSLGSNWGNWGPQGNANSTVDIPSAKGLKAGVDITITGGMINIDSSDDSIHTNDSLTISGGDITLASGDDGLHADATLEINGGNLNITQSYEGIESAKLTINGGTIHVVSSDDGINAAGGVDGSAINGRPGQNFFELSGDYHLAINGGYIWVDAGGDGLDINGTIDMTGGTVLVNGPTSNNNGALDYMGTFNITGGYLVAVGSAGMAQAPSASSTQYSVMHNFQSPQATGTMVHIETEAGDEILTFVPTKEYQSVVFSTPELSNGATYTIYTGGSSSGASADGLYTGGTYTPGVQIATLNITGIVTGAGAMGGGFPGGPGGRGRPPRP